MSTETILIPQWLLNDAPRRHVVSGQTILVRADTIAAVDRLSVTRRMAPEANEISLPGCLVMAGFVNAHQHGKGLGEVRFGYPDNFLEVWLHGRVGRGPIDAYSATLIAAAEMLENGVTSAVHANSTFGAEDYEQELRASLRAYDESGLRVTVAIGAADRLALVYPHTEESRFLDSLPADISAKFRARKPFSYAGSADKTIHLMDRLLADYRGHPRIRFCYGPAGPQWVSDDLFRSLADDAVRRGLGLHLHGLESIAQAAVCRHLYPEGTLRHLKQLGVLTPKAVLAHAVYLTEDDLSVAVESDITVVRNAGSNLRLRNGISPMGRFLSHGLRVAIGTDNTSVAQDEDLLKELRLAAALARSPFWRDPPPPSREQLLDMLTVHGATAAQGEVETGQLKVGKRADLTAVNLERSFWPGPQPGESPIDALLNRAEGRDVVMTMVDGNILYQNGNLTKLSKDRLAAMGKELLRGMVHLPEKEREYITSLLQEQMGEYYLRFTEDFVSPDKPPPRGLGPA